MSINPPACTRKGCTFDEIHHHRIKVRSGWRDEIGDAARCTGPVSRCYTPRGNEFWAPPVAPRAPRPSRKFLTAEVARLSAELADVHDEVADKKDRLARAELQAESDALAIAGLGRQIAAVAEPVDPDAPIVEAMAKACIDTWCRPGEWATRVGSNRDKWRTNMRAALAAAREAGAL